MSYTYEHLGLYHKANQFHFIAKEYIKLVGEDSSIGFILYNAGILYALSNQFEEALLSFNQALEEFIKNDSENGIQITINSMGELYIANNLLDKAMDSFFSVVGYSDNLNDNYGLALAYQNIGEVYLRKGNYKLAGEYLLRALEIKEESKIFESRILNQIGQYYLTIGNYTSAYTYFNEALNRAKLRGEVLEIKNAFYNITAYHNKMGDKSKAFNSLLSFKLHNDSLRNNLFAKQLQEVQNKYRSIELDDELNNLQIETSQKDNELRNERLKLARKILN